MAGTSELFKRRYAGGTFHGTWCIPITLANITGAADVVTDYTAGFDGSIVRMAFIVTTAVTTGSKAVTLNLEIGAVNVTSVPGTNATIALTSANCTPLGAIVAGSAIGGSNNFNVGSTISVEAASVTAFSEGAGVLLIEYEGKT